LQAFECYGLVSAHAHWYASSTNSVIVAGLMLINDVLSRLASANNLAA
jgi:hypothetical protein